MGDEDMLESMLCTDEDLLVDFVAIFPIPTPPLSGDSTFVTASGTTFYAVHQNPTCGKSICDCQCATAWTPALAADGAKAVGDWTIATRDNGLKQWTYKGKPVYARTKDAEAGIAKS
jgi:predicted lipoprotein with Yx(FWY)xxD motif